MSTLDAIDNLFKTKELSINKISNVEELYMSLNSPLEKEITPLI